MNKQIFAAILLLLGGLRLNAQSQPQPQTSPKPTLITVPGNNNVNSLQLADTADAMNNPDAAFSTAKPSSEKVMICFNGLIATPDGQFHEVSNGNWGAGLTGYFAYNPFHESLNNNWIRPFIIGLQLEYIWFNSMSENFSGNDVAARTETRSRVTQGAFAIGPAGRIEFLSKVIYPFFEYNVGLRFFNGTHKITFTRYPYSGNPATTDEVSQTLSSAGVGYYGYAGGIGIKLPSNVRVEFKLGYQRGGRATYIDPESVVINSNNTVGYSTKSSRTDMFFPQIGISGTF